MKYTKDERIEIGRQVYTCELLKKDAIETISKQFTNAITNLLLFDCSGQTVKCKVSLYGAVGLGKNSRLDASLAAFINHL